MGGYGSNVRLNSYTARLSFHLSTLEAICISADVILLIPFRTLIRIRMDEKAKGHVVRLCLYLNRIPMNLNKY